MKDKNNPGSSEETLHEAVSYKDKKTKSNYGQLEDKELQKKGWLVLCALLFAGIIAIMNQFKVPTFMGDFIPIFGSPGNAGWLMSVIAVAGIVTAFPSAFLLNRFGPKRIGMVGLGCMVVGCTIGAGAATLAGEVPAAVSWLPPVLIIGRLIEGMGVATMGVVATTIISLYFPREKAGLPMGLWNLWYVVGATLAYNIGVPISLALTGDPHGWQAWWWFCDVAALVAFIVFALLVSVPSRKKTASSSIEKARRHAHKPQQSSTKVLLEGLKVKRMWVFGLGFCFLLGTSLCVLTWVPTYMQDMLMGDLIVEGLGQGMGQEEAAAYAASQAGIIGGAYSSIGFAASIPVTIIFGFLLGRFTSFKARNRIAIFAACTTFLYTFAFLIPYEYLPYYLVLLGFEAGWTSSILWAMVPITMPKRVTIPIGMAIVIFFQGISNLLCMPVVGYVIGPDMVWTNVAPLCFTTAAIGTILWVIYTRMKPPVFDEDEEVMRLDDTSPVASFKKTRVS